MTAKAAAVMSVPRTAGNGKGVVAIPATDSVAATRISATEETTTQRLGREDQAGSPTDPSRLPAHLSVRHRT